MNMNVNKTNTGKLLVAVLAMAMVIASAAVIVGGSNVSADPIDGDALIAMADEDQVINLNENIVLSEAVVLDGYTINCGKFNITTAYDISGGTTGLTINSTGSSNNTITLSGNANISNVKFNLTEDADNAGMMPFAINTSSFTSTITNCTFASTGGNAIYGAVHTNGTAGATCEVTLNDCQMDSHGVVYYKGASLKITNGSEVNLSFALTNKTALSDDNLTVSSDSNIGWTIFGWPSSTTGGTDMGIATEYQINKNSNLGEISAGDAVADGDKIELKINTNVTAYGGEGIDTLTVAEKKTFTVKEGEAYNGGTITGKGNLVSKGATVNSTITVTGNVTMDGIALGNDLIAIQDTVLPISGNAYLTEDLVIPSDKTLRFVSGSTLELNGHHITVQGTLEVEYGAVIKSNQNDANEYIALDRNGAIANEGTIGYGANAVTIKVLNDANASYSGKGSVEMQNVSGVVLSVVNSGESTTGTPAKPIYILAVTGSIYAEDDSQATHSITVKDARIIKDVVIGQGVSLITNSTEKTYLYNGANMTVDGSVNASGLVMMNGSTISLNGAVVDKITAQTGDNAINATTPAYVDTTVDLDPNDNYVLNGLVLTVGQVNYVDDSKTPAVTMVSQRLYLDGTVTAVYTGTEAQGTVPPQLGTITVNNPTGGKSYVAADSVLSLGAGINMVGSGTVVLGQLQYVDTSLVASGFVGTQYSVQSTGATGAKTTTYYITTFENAYGEIANAYQTTINVYGNLDIEIDIDLQAKQRITFNGTADIAEDNTVIVRSQAAIGQINDVQGVLTKYNGASCNAPKSFVVEKKTTEYTSWSGLGPAIAGAQPGDVIDVKNNGTVKNDMTVPAGVTLNIDNGATLKFEKDLTIAETAKLVNKGGIDMAGDKSKISVAGELTSTEGTIAFSKAPEANKADTRAINVTGTAVIDTNKITVAGDSLDFADVINGAVYLNNDNQTVLTTVTAAITGVEATDAIQKTVTLYGNVNESADITLGSATTLKLDASAEVVLGTVNLTAAETGNGAKVDASVGKLTATVAGAVGAVDIDATTNVTVQVTSYTSADNVKSDYVMLGGTIDGSVTVASGKVNAAGLTVDGDENLLTVASGATLAVENVADTAQTLTVGATGKDLKSPALVVDGTLLFDGGELEEANDRQIILVNGTMTLADEANVDVDGILNVTGTLDISTTADKEAVLNVYSHMTVGTEPTTLGVGGSVNGQVSLTTPAFIIAYSGADVSGMIVNPDANGTTAVDTEFFVNDTLYMTAYTAKAINVELSKVLEVPEFKISGFETKVTGTDAYALSVTGTVNVSTVENDTGAFDVKGTGVTVGTPAESLGVGGSVVGPVTIDANNYIVVFAGADMSGAQINEANGESTAETTEYYINGTLFATAYAQGTVAIGTPVTVAMVKEISGIDTSSLTTIEWTDAEGKDLTVPNVGDIEAVYVKFDPAKAWVQYSAGSQISLYVDGVRVTSGDEVQLAVGTHTVTATVNPGYTGDVTITFNGQAVTGEFTVTSDMVGNAQTDAVVLSATGQISVDTGSSGSSSDGMGLTEILLVILVILIVVMAIMVALRLMRS